MSALASNLEKKSVSHPGALIKVTVVLGIVACCIVASGIFADQAGRKARIARNSLGPDMKLLGVLRSMSGPCQGEITSGSGDVVFLYLEGDRWQLDFTGETDSEALKWPDLQSQLRPWVRGQTGGTLRLEFEVPLVFGGVSHAEFTVQFDKIWGVTAVSQAATWVTWD